VALNDDATLIPDTGNYFTAEVGTAFPEDLTSIPSPWTPIGHTSLEDVLGFESEGGDSTVIATLQNKTLRTKRTPRTDSMNVTLQQFDREALKLYFGSNAVDVEDGKLIGVPQNPTPTTVAFLAVFYDGENAFAVYAPKAEIFRAEDIDITDTETLANLPLKVTPLITAGNEWAYAVTPMGALVEEDDDPEEP